jgi:pentafunctional AROM polypeptide
LELRVDLLSSLDISYVKEQVSLLKAHTTLPIIFTLRSSDQGGKFDGSPEEAQNLLGMFQSREKGKERRRKGG